MVGPILENVRRADPTAAVRPWVRGVVHQLFGGRLVHAKRLHRRRARPDTRTGLAATNVVVSDPDYNTKCGQQVRTIELLARCRHDLGHYQCRASGHHLWRERMEVQQSRPPFTLVGATTRSGALTGPLRIGSGSPRTWISTSRPSWSGCWPAPPAFGHRGGLRAGSGARRDAPRAGPARGAPGCGVRRVDASVSSGAVAIEGGRARSAASVVGCGPAASSAMVRALMAMARWWGSWARRDGYRVSDQPVRRCAGQDCRCRWAGRPR